MRRIISLSFLYAGFFSLTASAQKPELVVQTGHSAAVRSVAFSHDGRTLASGSSYGTIKLWDVRNARELRTLKHKSHSIVMAAAPNLTSERDLPSLAGQSEMIRSVAFSPDDRMLASAILDIKLWDVARGNELRTLSGQTIGVSCVAFSPDGRTLRAEVRTKSSFGM